MRLRKILAGLVAGALAMATMAAAVSAEKVDLDKDLKGALEDKGTYLQKAGGPTFEYTTQYGIKISGRTADWNALDFKFDNLEAGKTYALTVKFLSAKETQFGIVQADSPYGWTVVSDENVKKATLEYTFTLDADKKVDGQNRMRLNTPGQKVDYYVASIDISEVVEQEEGTGEEASEEEVSEEASEEVSEEASEEVTEEESEEPPSEEEETEIDNTPDNTGGTGSGSGTGGAGAGTGGAGTGTGGGNYGKETDTGAEGVAVLFGVAIIAAGAVLVSRKRK